MVYFPESKQTIILSPKFVDWRFSTRLVKSRNDLNIVKRANRGFKLANYISRASRRVSVSGLKEAYVHQNQEWTSGSIFRF